MLSTLDPVYAEKIGVNTKIFGLNQIRVNRLESLTCWSLLELSMIVIDSVPLTPRAEIEVDEIPRWFTSSIDVSGS